MSADSLQVLKAGEGARQWVDLGSGAGFPGLVTAIALMQDAKSQGDAHVHLVESNQRKVAFLRAVIRETGCPATVHAERIEAVAEELASSGTSPIQAVSARGACGSFGSLRLCGALCASRRASNFPQGEKFSRGGRASVSRLRLRHGRTEQPHRSRQPALDTQADPPRGATGKG
jgi:16S rRNA (guanine527-N7)-methyltransferase